jgi:hypothetical protein
MAWLWRSFRALTGINMRHPDRSYVCMIAGAYVLRQFAQDADAGQPCAPMQETNKNRLGS